MNLVLHRHVPSDAEARIAELERKVVKLEKINAALMDRVERSMDAQGSAFSLFQTAIGLAAMLFRQGVRVYNAMFSEV
jgi:hypothetical protein